MNQPRDPAKGQFAEAAGWRRIARRSIVLVPILALGLTALAVSSVLLVVRAADETGRLVHANYLIISDAEELYAALADAETDQRTYLLTNEPAALESFRASKVRVTNEIAELDVVLAGSPNAARLRAISSASHRRLASLEAEIGLVAPNGNRSARFESGRVTMGQLRDAISALVQDEEARLRQRRLELDRQKVTAALQTLAAIVALLLAGAFMFGAFFRARARFTEQEAETEAADQRFSAMFDHAAAGMALLAPDGTWLRVNNRFCEIGGYDPEQLIGTHLSEITHPDDVALDLANLNDLLSGKTTHYSVEKRYVKASGEVRWVKVSAAIVRKLNGEPDFIVKVTEDISDWKDALTRLVTGEAQYRAIFDSAVEAIAVIDDKGLIQSMNPAAKRIFGFEPHESIGRNISMLMPAAIAAQHDGYLADYKKTGKRAIIGIGREVIGQRKDGTSFPLDLSVAEWRQEGATFYTGIMRDITDRKEVEEALRASEQRLRLALASGDLGTWSINLKSGELHFDRLAQAIFHTKADRLNRVEEFEALLHPDDRPMFDRQYQSLVAGADALSFECRLLDTDGSVRWAQVSGTVDRVASPDSPQLIGVVVDVTDKRDSAERLRILQNEFAHLARVNDLGEMAAAIAHEINQPMTAITNYLKAGLEVAKRTGGKRSQSGPEPMMERAADQALRAGQIVRRLREFIAKGTGERENRPADQLIDAVTEFAAVDAAVNGVTVIRNAAAGDAIVSVDVVQFQQVALNLIRNAIDALSTNPPDAERKLTIETKIANEHTSVEFAIADTGPGISAEIGPKLFEPFTTSKASGMGMGLSVCRRLIEAHGGSITIESPASGGAIFRFNLPLATVEA